MLRIYRDTRFSNDKSPYKTHVAAQFRRRSGDDVHAPGFYLHLEPGGCIGGGRIWHRETKHYMQHQDGPREAYFRWSVDPTTG